MGGERRRISLEDFRRALILKIAAAQVNTDPSPHFIIDSVFDPDLYNAFLKNWPSYELFKKLSDMGRISYDVERFAILFMKHFGVIY